jgi:hypothetical protein
VKKFFGLYIVHDPKYHDLRARGQWTKKKYFLAFSILLDGLAHISAIFLLKMQKKSKIGSPYCTVPNVYNITLGKGWQSNEHAQEYFSTEVTSLLLMFCAVYFLSTG